MPQCMICGRQLCQINFLHLRTHGTNTRDYRQSFPVSVFRDLAVTERIRLKLCGRKRPEHAEYMKLHSPSKRPEVAAKIRASRQGRPRPDLCGANNPATREAVREKIRLKAMLRWENPEYRRSMTGPNNPFYGRRHTQKTKEKLAWASTMRVPVNISSLESRALKLLPSFGERPVTQHPIFIPREVLPSRLGRGIGTLVDIAFPEQKIALYIDGSYWHSLPKVRRTDGLINLGLRRLGWKVIRVDERFLKDVSTLKRYIDEKL